MMFVNFPPPRREGNPVRNEEIINEIDKLSDAEQKELEKSIAEGIGITRSCEKAKIDWFNILLSTGKRCCGAYRYYADGYLRLRIYEGKLKTTVTGWKTRKEKNHELKMEL